jgi:hypothetical protein
MITINRFKTIVVMRVKDTELILFPNIRKIILGPKNVVLWFVTLILFVNIIITA